MKNNTAEKLSARTGPVQQPDDVLVIGAGASGLTAAIAAAREGARVRVLERNSRPGRKLLLTGNGRCNMTNMDPVLPSAYHSVRQKAEAADLPKQVLAVFGVSDTLRFFEEIGLMTQERDGYVYPRSGQAQSVLNVLLAELEKLHVKMKYQAEVTGLDYDPDEGLWTVRTDGWAYPARQVILACGSRAGLAESEKSRGADAWELVKHLGHTVTEPWPALTAMHCPDPDLKLCEGARTKAGVTLSDAGSGAVAGREEGELQWTASEVSGIPVFQLSRFTYGLSVKKPMLLMVDFYPEYSEEFLKARLMGLFSSCREKESLSRLMEGFVHARLAAFLVKKAGLRDGFRPEKAEETAAVFASLLKRLELTVDGVRDFSRAQICLGGVSPEEVSAVTMESRICPGLYLTGELLDIDGPCGGYNLQWAFSSGMTAGRAAGKKSREKPKTAE